MEKKKPPTLLMCVRIVCACLALSECAGWVYMWVCVVAVVVVFCCGMHKCKKKKKFTLIGLSLRLRVHMDGNLAFDCGRSRRAAYIHACIVDD